MIKIEALQFAEQINLKQFKASFSVRQHSGGVSEKFYVLENDTYLYLLNYGVVIFGNYNKYQKEEFLEYLKQFCTNLLPAPLQEDYTVETDESLDRPSVTSPSLLLPKNYTSLLGIRLAMLYTGQSVALDYYEQLTYEALTETHKYTEQMEKHGKVNAGKRNLLRFVGRSMNIKNSIVDNLYILDDPGIVWDDPELDRINKGLKDTFDIQIRFRDLDSKLRIIQDNLKLFTDLLQHRESARLEWIIIILILIEVINVFWREVF
jgi:uncharacterized Rmd1/YagE family protein